MAPRILIFSITMDAYNSFDVKFIATYGPTFFGYIISVLAMLVATAFPLKGLITPCTPLTHIFSDLPSALQWKITLLATVEDCKRVADHVH